VRNGLHEEDVLDHGRMSMSATLPKQPLNEHGDEDALDHDANNGLGGGEPGLQGVKAELDKEHTPVNGVEAYPRRVGGILEAQDGVVFAPQCHASRYGTSEGRVAPNGATAIAQTRPSAPDSRPWTDPLPQRRALSTAASHLGCELSLGATPPSGR
jgi:hypothetical protein